MFKQPTNSHDCSLCGEHTQTLHGRPCAKCQKRIAEQIKRYLHIAGMMANCMLIDFGQFQTGGRHVEKNS
jgi:hypothetical protein